MSKFNRVNPNLRADTWGPFFAGVDARDLDAEEARLRELILSGRFPKARADKLLAELDTATPFVSRIGFIEYLAALSVVHPEDVNKQLLRVWRRQLLEMFVRVNMLFACLQRTTLRC